MCILLTAGNDVLKAFGSICWSNMISDMIEAYNVIGIGAITSACLLLVMQLHGGSIKSVGEGLKYAESLGFIEVRKQFTQLV